MADPVIARVQDKPFWLPWFWPYVRDFIAIALLINRLSENPFATINPYLLVVIPQIVTSHPVKSSQRRELLVSSCVHALATLGKLGIMNSVCYSLAVLGLQETCMRLSSFMTIAGAWVVPQGLKPLFSLACLYRLAFPDDLDDLDATLTRIATHSRYLDEADPSVLPPESTKYLKAVYTEILHCIFSRNKVGALGAVKKGTLFVVNNSFPKEHLLCLQDTFTDVKDSALRDRLYYFSNRLADGILAASVIATCYTSIVASHSGNIPDQDLPKDEEEPRSPPTLMSRVRSTLSQLPLGPTQSLVVRQPIGGPFDIDNNGKDNKEDNKPPKPNPTSKQKPIRDFQPNEQSHVKHKHLRYLANAINYTRQALINDVPPRLTTERIKTAGHNIYESINCLCSMPYDDGDPNISDFPNEHTLPDFLSDTGVNEMRELAFDRTLQPNHRATILTHVFIMDILARVLDHVYHGFFGLTSGVFLYRVGISNATPFSAQIRALEATAITNGSKDDEHCSKSFLSDMSKCLKIIQGEHMQPTGEGAFCVPEILAQIGSHCANLESRVRKGATDIQALDTTKLTIAATDFKRHSDFIRSQSYHQAGSISPGLIYEIVL